MPVTSEDSAYVPILHYKTREPWVKLPPVSALVALMQPYHLFWFDDE